MTVQRKASGLALVLILVAACTGGGSSGTADNGGAGTSGAPAGGSSSSAGGGASGGASPGTAGGASPETSGGSAAPGSPAAGGGGTGTSVGPGDDLCKLLGPADFAAVGVSGTGPAKENNPDANNAYCVYAGSSAGTGGVEFDAYRASSRAAMTAGSASRGASCSTVR